MIQSCLQLDLLCLSIYTKNKTTVVYSPIYNGTTFGYSVLKAEVNPVATCAESINRCFLFNSLLITFKSLDIFIGIHDLKKWITPPCLSVFIVRFSSI